MNKKWITVLGILLVTIIAGQSYYTYQLSRQLDQFQAKVADRDSGTKLSENKINKNSSPLVNGPLKPPLGQGQTLSDFLNFDMDFLSGLNQGPVAHMRRMQNEFDKLFNNMQTQFGAGTGLGMFNGSENVSPVVNIQEENNQYRVTVEIPGANQSDIKVNLENNQLTISANTESSNQSSNQNGSASQLQQSRYYGQYTRTISLDKPVMSEKMKTEFDHGKLLITIPIS